MIEIKKINCYPKEKSEGEINMGVSMGVIKTLDVKASRQFREDSKKGVLKTDTIKKCRELAKKIVTR